MRRSILQLLLIRESESKLVSRLFIFEFFQGAAIALYFIVSISIFVDHLPATELPKVFILSAFLLWLFGFIYSKIEHLLLTRHLVYFVLIFNGMCILLFRVFIHWQGERWFLYVFLASFNILYLFNNLEFWGLVALLFDVRQSKRLFAIVSAWDGPSRMVGYGIAGLFAYFTGGQLSGTENLLWIAVFFMLISVLLFIPLAKSDEMRHLAPTTHHHYATQSLKNVQAALTGNKLIRNAALVSFFSFCFYLVTNFVLYGYVKKEFHSDKSLAGFFAVFLVISRGLTLVIKPLFINRLLDKLGLRKSLLVAPVVLLILCIVSFFFSGGQTKKVFYMFMIMAIAIDILRSAIQSPVLLATLQPLPAQQRLRAHTIIKGLMDPVAFLATGILLLVLISSWKEINFELLSAVLLVITGFWLFFAFSVDKHYINMLTAAIRRRELDERDISITDKDSLNFLLNRLENGTGKEAISVLQLVSLQAIDHEKFYMQALRHKSPEVKRFALELIHSHRYEPILPELKRMLYAGPVAETLPQLVRTVALLDKTEDISAYLQHDDAEVVNAAAQALLTHPDQEKRMIGEQHLLILFESNQTHRQVNALQMVGALKVQEFSGRVYDLLMQQDEPLRYHAVMAAGRLAGKKLIQYLLSVYLNSSKYNDILEALRQAGDSAVGEIDHFLETTICTAEKRRRLFVLLGKIGGNSAMSLLQKYLHSFPQDSGTLLSILFQLHFKCLPEDPLYKKLLKETLETASGHLFRLNFLQNQLHKYPMVLQAMELELLAVKDKSIWLFSFLYDSAKIRRAKDGFDLNTKESVANSFELIEMTVPKEYASLFILLFEHTDFGYKLDRLAKFYKEPVMNISTMAKAILTIEQVTFSDWTKACILYNLKNEKGLLGADTVQPYLESENLMLSEIAALIIKRENQVV